MGSLTATRPVFPGATRGDEYAPPRDRGLSALQTRSIADGRGLLRRAQSTQTIRRSVQAAEASEHTLNPWHKSRERCLTSEGLFAAAPCYAAAG